MLSMHWMPREREDSYFIPVTLTYTTGSPRHEDHLGEISSILTLFLYSFMMSINLSANESGIHLVNNGHFGGTHILWHLASGTQE